MPSIAEAQPTAISSLSPEAVRRIAVAVRWEAEAAFLIADLFHDGVPPSRRDIDRLALACRRLQRAIEQLPKEPSA